MNKLASLMTQRIIKSIDVVLRGFVLPLASVFTCKPENVTAKFPVHASCAYALTINFDLNHIVYIYTQFLVLSPNSYLSTKNAARRTYSGERAWIHAAIPPAIYYRERSTALLLHEYLASTRPDGFSSATGDSHLATWISSIV